MPIRESDKASRARYRSSKTEQINLVLYPTEEDIKSRLEERLSEGEPKSTYIKRLIREDIARK
jgi:hypothetical protein